MPANADHLRFILGLKLKHERLERGLSLKQVAEAAGLSISYLSEIEKGRKYPKADKVLDLANALDVPFDDLVSLRVGQKLSPLKELFSSHLIQEFPFEMFGLEQQDFFGLITEEPGKVGALMQTFVEIGQMYNVSVEHFLFAALRSYQQMHNNYFPDLEEAAADFRKANDWDAPIGESRLANHLREVFNYLLDYETLPADADLQSFRSVFRDGEQPVLYINGELLPEQRAFVLAREIGFRVLDLKERPTTSSWIRAESFDQVLNNFKASYFAGALLIDRTLFREDVASFFDNEQWKPDALEQLVERHRATPEMVFYRLTELLPELFNLEDIFFMRFFNERETDYTVMNKVLNLSEVPIPHGIGMDEHHCRRWPALTLLKQLRLQQSNGSAHQHPSALAQRSHFMGQDTDYFVMSMARPLSLSPNTNSCVSIGLRMGKQFKRTVKFWNDDALASRRVHLTCERCPLSPAECRERVVPASIYEQRIEEQQKQEALDRLFKQALPADAST